jgi:hypothetical protein
MARPELDERFSRSKLHRYLLADEIVLVAQRQHWAALWKTILIGVAALLVAVTLNLVLPPGGFTDLLWWALLAVGIWAAMKWYEWRRSWMVATDKRVMVNHGLFRQGVAMFSLSRVPDLTYTRSSIGQLLGSLHKINFVEHPHATYTTICAAIFELQDRMFGMDDDEPGPRREDGRRPQDGSPQRDPGLYAGHVPPEETTPPTDSPNSPNSPRSPDEPDEDDDLVETHIRYGTTPQDERDTPDHVPDQRYSALSDPEAVPYRRPATDEGGWLPTINEQERGKTRNQGQSSDPGKKR